MPKNRNSRNIHRLIQNIRMSILVLVFVTVVSTAQSIYYRDRARIDFVSVGQGDGTLITTPGGRHILIDAGSYFNNNPEKSIMSDYLLKNGVWSLDIVIVSHYHADHYGGLLGILQKYNTKIVFLPLPQTKEELDISNQLAQSLKNRSTKIFFMKVDESVELGENIDLSLLYYDTSSRDTNDRSLIIAFRCYDTKVLFTGDITFWAEDNILRDVNKPRLRCDIIKVAHHGSKYSSSDEFYEASAPSYSVVQVGNNMYGHPADETLVRIGAASEVYRTDENGTITFYINREGITVRKLY